MEMHKVKVSIPTTHSKTVEVSCTCGEYKWFQAGTFQIKNMAEARREANWWKQDHKEEN